MKQNIPDVERQMAQQLIEKSESVTIAQIRNAVTGVPVQGLVVDHHSHINLVPELEI